MATNGPARPASQVTLKTVFTVCFGVLAVAGLVLFLLRTQVAATLSLGAAMLAVAMNHAVEVLTRRRLPRKVAVAAVVFSLLALTAGLSLMLIPPMAIQAKALFAAAPTLWQKLQQTRLFLALDARFDLTQQIREAVPAAAGAVAPVLTAIGSLLSAVAGLVTLLLLAIFMLLFGRDLVLAMLAGYLNRDRDAEVLDWKPTRSPEREAQLEINEIDQMRASLSELRRRRGVPEPERAAEHRWET